MLRSQLTDKKIKMFWDKTKLFSFSREELKRQTRAIDSYISETLHVSPEESNDFGLIIDTDNKDITVTLEHMYDDEYKLVINSGKEGIDEYYISDDDLHDLLFR